ncbi:type VII secretion protein EccCa [Aeromicrobium sp. CF4.19]|uniref:type VII secretion protein EccCa n=1 Tax=Aeromicrobium sp. CF4.19 TaxID=3373082 RepID=UPI003EE56046
MTTTLVKRPTRLAPPQRTSQPLSIEPPPNRGQGAPPMAGAGMMMMPIMGGTGSITIAITQKDRPIVAVAAFLALIGAIAIGALMVISQRSGTKRQVRESRERYLDYIESLRHTVRDQIFAQRAEQAWRHPRAEQLYDIACDENRRWERRASHGDFLAARLGTGDVALAAGLTMEADTGPLNDFDPVCLQAAQEMQQRYATLRDQPIVVPLARIGQLSVIGNPAARRALATHVLLQMVTLQSPNDVQVAVVRSDDTAAAWDWTKWLPHVQESTRLDGDLQGRRVATSIAAMAELLAPDLEARLDRHSRSRGGENVQPTHLVVVVDGEGLPTGQHLLSPDASVSLAQLGVHVISLHGEARHEPEGVDLRLEVDDHGSVTTSARPEPFRMDVAPAGSEAAIARQLSALRLTHEDVGEDGLSDTVGLPEILGVDDPARLDPSRTWRPRALRDLLRVPIGVGATGQSVILDLKESAHGGMGPHGLVVGATGSGKSEMLRTLVSSLVVGHGPDRLALMLVDFKGGATFASMEEIPHIAGTITNLQDDLTLVDRMRDALYGEMQRRQEILKRAGNLPNVTAYQDRIDAGEDLEPLPHLLVIVDEFSELLTAKPDFAEMFVAIGRIGRSIGVHLLLATQKLEMGKIRGLESHLSYRISLRTFSESESRDAIGVPDAFHLPPEPGSGYLKVDTTVFERFKAALVSSPYVAPSEGPKTTVPVVPYVALDGIGAWLAQQAAAASDEAVEAITGRASASDPSVLDVLCERIAGAGAPRVRPVWLDPLPESLALGDLTSLETTRPATSCRAVLGLVDDPKHQDQFPLEWDFTGGGANLVVTGSPQTGKSVLVRTMVLSMAMTYAPGDVVFYCIDYGGGSLSSLQDVPHVATVTSRVDPERIQRTVNDVRGILDRREAMFRERGFESMAGFRQARAAGELPDSERGDVFLVVDGWGTFRDEWDDLDYAIADIAARGSNFGVHVVITVTQAMQVRMRMQGSMGGRIELRLNDAYESEFERAVSEQIPRDSTGRGITGTRKAANVFQSALPVLEVPAPDPMGDDEYHDLDRDQRTLVAAVKDKWGDRSVERVQVLPRRVELADLPPIELGDKGILVGLSELNLGAAEIDLWGGDPHLQVYGDGETGKSNLLKLIIHNLVTSRSSDEIGIAVVDYRRSLLDVVPKDYLLAYSTGAEQTAGMVASIGGAINDRVPGPDVTSEQLRTRSWWKGLEVFVIIDDYDLVATSQGDPLLGLVDLLPQGRDLGFHLVLARRTGGMSRAVFEPLIQRLIDLSAPGFMFSGDRMEGRLIGGHASRRLPKGRAMYINRDGGASLVQTAVAETTGSEV